MVEQDEKLNLVLEFLMDKKDQLLKEIQEEQGQQKKKIEFKEQILTAIEQLKLCEVLKLKSNKIEVIEIPEGGSDAHFTEFNMVDEAAIDLVEDWAIKKDKNGPIKLNCFDLILRKKEI